jgi:hypothetical protein
MRATAVAPQAASPSAIVEPYDDDIGRVRRSSVKRGVKLPGREELGKVVTRAVKAADLIVVRSGADDEADEFGRWLQRLLRRARELGLKVRLTTAELEVLGEEARVANVAPREASRALRFRA